MPRKTPRYEDEYVFRIPTSQLGRLRQWILEIDTKLATSQIETGKGLGGQKLSSGTIRQVSKSIERGEPSPYYGAIGGVYEYSFVPTSVGIVITVKNSVSGDIIDLSEYDRW